MLRTPRPGQAQAHVQSVLAALRMALPQHGTGGPQRFPDLMNPVLSQLRAIRW